MVDDLDRRVRVIRVAQHDVLTVFGALGKDHECLSLPEFVKLPKGYVVVAVQAEWQRECFSFLVRHPEFSPIPVGQEIPALADQPWELKRTTYVKPHVQHNSI